jgi:hypothetical protein
MAGAVRQMRTRISLLAQPASMRSILGTTQLRAAAHQIAGILALNYQQWAGSNTTKTAQSRGWRRSPCS